MADKKLTKKTYQRLLKMNVEQLKAFIKENDSVFVKHIPGCDHECYFNGMYQNALLSHALSLRRAVASKA